MNERHVARVVELESVVEGLESLRLHDQIGCCYHLLGTHHHNALMLLLLVDVLPSFAILGRLLPLEVAQMRVDDGLALLRALTPGPKQRELPIDVVSRCLGGLAV